MDALSWSALTTEAPPLEEDEYAKLYKIDEPVIKFKGGVNEIQHVQCSKAEIAEEQAKDEVWSEVISWVEQEWVPEKAGIRGKVREVLVACSMFDPEVFKMRDRVLMFIKAANRNSMGEVWWICLLESMVLEVCSLCHQSDVGGHRRLEGTLNKFLKGLFMLSARQKIHFLNSRCDTCLNKELSMPVRAGEHLPLLTGYVGEKLYV